MELVTKVELFEGVEMLKARSLGMINLTAVVMVSARTRPVRARIPTIIITVSLLNIPI